MKTFFLFLCAAFTTVSYGQSSLSIEPVYGVMGSPLVSFLQFETLADSVERYRENRLISAQDFVAFSQDKNTIILDTRSKKFFDQKHVKGAINLPFADFTQENLEALIPNKNTRILIYCNNNFMAELSIDNKRMISDRAFASKVSIPTFKQVKIAEIPSTTEGQLRTQPLKYYPLNLTRPNSINIYGYGTSETFNFSRKQSAASFLEFKLPNFDSLVQQRQLFLQQKTYTLALNIPTFINLYGYGYQNVYELKDLIATSSSGGIQFEGSEAPTINHTGIISSTPSSPLVNYTDLQELVDLVKPHREERLITLDQFNQMKLDENTIILDTRSKEMYEAKHVKGAVHLEFSDFTQETLDNLMEGNRDKRILIYCNNNFITDIEKNQQDRYFMSKVALSPPKFMSELTLALNIPTYINLYGYGYQNVYELNELVVTSDPRIQFEGTSIK